MIKNKYAALKPNKPWWLVGDIPVGNCVAAYQAAGANSYEASKINVNSPGLYTAANAANYPTWTSAAGWIFAAASKQCLTTTISPNLKPVTYIARVTVSDTAAEKSIIGQTTTYNGLSLYLIRTTNIPELTETNVAVIGRATNGFASGVDKVVAVSYSAAGVYAHYLDGALNGTGTSNETLTAGGGMQIGAHDNYRNLAFNGSIAALAVYNDVLTQAQVYALTTAMNAL